MAKRMGRGAPPQAIGEDRLLLPGRENDGSGSLGSRPFRTFSRASPAASMYIAPTNGWSFAARSLGALVRARVPPWLAEPEFSGVPGVPALPLRL